MRESTSRVRLKTIPEQRLFDLPEGEPPSERSDCENGPRPCPWICCQYHLAPEASGPLLVLIASDGLGAMPHTCTIDAANAGGMRLDDIGAIFGVTRERIRQIEMRALHKLAVRDPKVRCMLDDLKDELRSRDRADNW